MMLGVELDRTDRRILAELQRDGRLSNQGAGRAGFAFSQSVPAPGTAPGERGLYQALRGAGRCRESRAGPAGLRHHQTEQAQRRQPRANGQLRPGCPIMARSGGVLRDVGGHGLSAAHPGGGPGALLPVRHGHPDAASGRGGQVPFFGGGAKVEKNPLFFFFFSPRAGTANPAVCRFSAQVREPASQGRGRGQHQGRAGGIMPMWRFPGSGRCCCTTVNESLPSGCKFCKSRVIVSGLAVAETQGLTLMPIGAGAGVSRSAR